MKVFLHSGFKILISTLVMIFLLSACSPLGPIPQKPVKTYLLNDPTPENGAGTIRGKKVLLLPAISIVPWLNTAKMAYQTTPQQISYFSQNQWINSPNELLHPIVLHALLHSQNYLAVVSTPYTGSYSQRLDLQVINFQQIFTQQPSFYNITLQARLIDNTSQRLIATKRFNIEVTAPADNPEGGVIAANQAVKMLLPQLVQFVSNPSANSPAKFLKNNYSLNHSIKKGGKNNLATNNKKLAVLPLEKHINWHYHG